MFLSSCPEVWGGSEELWFGAALNLARANHSIAVIKTNIDFNHPSIKRLQTVSKFIDDYEKKYDASVLTRAIRRMFPSPWLPGERNYAFDWLCQLLSRRKPKFAVISQGQNFDGIRFAQACIRFGIPYVLISQKASDTVWPSEKELDLMTQAFHCAQKAFFVSRHNLELTELQLGCKLDNAEVVHNPYMLSATGPLPWPESEDDTYRLACVGRLYVTEKGQDILLRVLSQPKWRNRKLLVSFFGQGIHLKTLKAMADYLDLRNVTFSGFTTDIDSVWKTHHALVLPSRCEGLPLALVEAMICGRPAIITDAGGSAELIEDGVTSFLATSATPDSFDRALEKAWQCRHQWQQIGLRASAEVKARVPSDACADFTSRILEFF